ncbi:MAG: NAD-dependent epimerase/dehydratase family protein [Phycisphaerae bacterium]
MTIAYPGLAERRRNVMSGDEVVRRDATFMIKSLEQEFEQMAGDRLLITGAAGFLGYYLAHAVALWNELRPGSAIRLTASDSYFRGRPDWLRQLGQQPGVDIETWDVRQPLPATFEPPQWIVHAASIASPTFYRAHPLETMDANVDGLRRLLDAAVTWQKQGTPAKGILFFSSSEIYGDPEVIPTPEDYRGSVSCTGPRACYDEAKRYGETLCTVFARHHGLPVKIARPFNNYGPGLKLNDRRVVSDFARDILAGRDIVMYSSGKATRTFCYVADAVVGYYKVLVNGHNGEAYNIGTEKPEISIGDFGRMMCSLGAELFGYRGRVVMQPPPDGDYMKDNPNRRCPVLDKASAHVRYQPRVELEDGLRRMLLWYADQPTSQEER